MCLVNVISLIVSMLLGNEYGMILVSWKHWIDYWSSR